MLHVTGRITRACLKRYRRSAFQEVHSGYNRGMRNLLRRVLPIAIVAVTVSFPQSPQYVQGPRGGCYEVTKSGVKKSVNRSLCAPNGSTNQSTQTGSGAQGRTKAQPPANNAPPVSSTSVPAETKVVKGNRTYVKGPKGGCYYVTASGRKEYVDRSMCQ